MNCKILITGLPRSGKSTLISKLLEYYTNVKKYSVYGFLTPEIRESGNRVGFNVVDIYTGTKFHLARVGNFKTKNKVGKYSVFIEQFNKYIDKTLNIDGKDVDLMIIDEIGKMELFSQNFQNFINTIFSSKISILATIGLNLNHPIKNYLKNLPSVLLLNLDRQNSQLLFEKVISLIP